MVSIPESAADHPAGFRVVWTRGEGCSQLAETLAATEPVRVVGDLRAACHEARADLLVARKLSSFELVNVAVPHSFDPGVFDQVVALVGSGPHSRLAGGVAAAIGRSVGLPAALATAYRSDEGRGAAQVTLEAIEADAGIPGKLLEAEGAADLIEQLGDRPLLVFGASGGWFLQRWFFGPGARLKAAAPAGVVVVRAAPERVFQRMADPVYVSCHLDARDATRLSRGTMTAVADEGRLVGVVSRSALLSAPAGKRVSDVMEKPVSVSVDDPLEAVEPVAARFADDPVPVVDEDGKLRGSIRV
jgi:CBS domain-containing protein